MRKWGRLYPNAGYGGRFGAWLNSDDRKPYNSWGNGSAMRVSPCAGYAFSSFQPGERPESSIEWALELARDSAIATHNHPEGVKGAQATAYCIMMAYGYGIEAAKEHIREEVPTLFGYDLSRTFDEIRPTYRFNESCQDTVPQAIIAFLESTGFEDAIRNAISLGGDRATPQWGVASSPPSRGALPKPPTAFRTRLPIKRSATWTRRCAKYTSGGVSSAGAILRL
jgi:ADP-ribosylglycohydrolase